MNLHSHRRGSAGGSNPSFSSTLLDSIYRSIDEGDEEVVAYKETIKMKKQHHKNGGFVKDEEGIATFQRICMIEKWMQEKKETQKVLVTRRRVSADFTPKGSDGFFSHSSSSSSDSSYSSSSISGYGVSSSSSNRYTLQKPKPNKTNGVDHQSQQQSPKPEKGFTKTKLKALKIYGDLKKVKQPISPGGKIATFLNSIFTSGSPKIPKNITPKGTPTTYHDGNASTCSSASASASSFSRSCLSKTQSSRGKHLSSNGPKRSVKFVDEACKPRSMEVAKTKDRSRSSINEELKLHIMEKNRRVEEAARDLLRNYQKRVIQLEYDSSRSTLIHNNDDVEDDDEDDDDAASYASSDLFELDNLSAIGEELPVYETTHLATNRAIANGRIIL